MGNAPSKPARSMAIVSREKQSYRQSRSPDTNNEDNDQEYVLLSKDLLCSPEKKLVREAEGLPINDSLQWQTTALEDPKNR